MQGQHSPHHDFNSVYTHQGIDTSDSETVSTAGGLATADGDVLELPPTLTVLGTPRGNHYHLPLGTSDICRCGAQPGQHNNVERMTLFHAERETELTRCGRCPWPDES